MSYNTTFIQEFYSKILFNIYKHFFWMRKGDVEMSNVKLTLWISFDSERFNTSCDPSKYRFSGMKKRIKTLWGTSDLTQRQYGFKNSIIKCKIRINKLTPFRIQWINNSIQFLGISFIGFYELLFITKNNWTWNTTTFFVVQKNYPTKISTINSIQNPLNSKIKDLF